MDITSPTMILASARQAELLACGRSCRPAGVARRTGPARWRLALSARSGRLPVPGQPRVSVA